MKIRWTERAFHDLRTISQRIEQHQNLAAANRVCRAIYNAIQLLRRHAFSGRPGSQVGTRERW